jgi:hypothetical protein
VQVACNVDGLARVRLPKELHGEGLLFRICTDALDDRPNMPEERSCEEQSNERPPQQLLGLAAFEREDRKWSTPLSSEERRMAPGLRVADEARALQHLRGRNQTPSLDHRSRRVQKNSGASAESVLRQLRDGSNAHETGEGNHALHRREDRTESLVSHADYEHTQERWVRVRDLKRLHSKPDLRGTLDHGGIQINDSGVGETHRAWRLIRPRRAATAAYAKRQPTHR